MIWGPENTRSRNVALTPYAPGMPPADTPAGLGVG